MIYSLGERLQKASQKYSSEIAIHWKKEAEWVELTCGEFKRKVESLAQFLSEKDIKKGDRVAILSENRPEWPVIFFATVLVGGVSVPINPEANQKEIENILLDSKCKIIFVDDSKKFSFIKDAISVDSEVFKKALKRHGKPEYVKVEEEDLASILYTSGTTDQPKGVMLTHKNLLSNAESAYKSGLITEKDSIVSILPLHHAYPLTVTMILPLVYGGRIVYPGSIRGEIILEAMQKTNPSVFVAVPQVLNSFYQKIDEKLKHIPFPFNVLFNFVINTFSKLRNKTGINLTRFLLGSLHKKFGKSLRFFASGGAKLDEDVAKGFFRLGFTILEGYGLTETSPILTMNPLEKPKIGSVGLSVPDVELKVINKDEKDIGEVIARGPNIMKGYYKRDDLTREAIKEEWFYTGDLGYFDKEGYLFLTGRSKDVIVLSSGLNINPEEIEEAYMKDAPVKEMCVLEVPSKKEGKKTQVLWAVVVPDLDFFKKYGEVNLKHVIKERFDNVTKTLPPYKRLMGFSITLEDLPHTLLGKVKRFEVKDIYIPKIAEEEEPEKKELKKEDKELMDSFFGKKIISFLKKQTNIKEITPSDSLEIDLGIDSLGRIDLAVGLEKLFGTEIKDEIIGQAFTVRDLIKGAMELALPKTVEGEPVAGKELRLGTDYWKKVLDVPPKKENLERIDLNPGPIVWLGCYLFTLMHWIYFKLFYKHRVEGAENFPKEGNYILYVNHTSYFDGFLVAISLPHFPKLNLFFVGFRPYFTVPIIRNLVKIGRIIPLDFSEHLLEALRSSYYVLKNGKSLCLFPEGLRTLDGKIGKFKKGFGILAKELKPKLVPVALEGAYEAWPRTQKYPKRHPIKVKFGKPIEVDEAEKEGFKLGAKDSYEAVCMGARKVLKELKGEE